MWQVELHPEVDRWYFALIHSEPETADLIEEAIDLLASEGPMLGRPMVDRIKGSRYHNLKELRTGSVGDSEIRILFAFDPRRMAILLVAGDKSGRWGSWYDENIPIAERRYEAHLATLERGR